MSNENNLRKDLEHLKVWCGVGEVWRQEREAVDLSGSAVRNNGGS